MKDDHCANPFPATASTSIEGVTLNSWVNPVPLDPVPTYVFPWLTELRHVVAVYLGNRSRAGNCVLLQGPHGSGKTHAVRDALTQIRQGSPSPVLLYVKVSAPDFTSMWRGLVSDLRTDQGLDQLRQAGRLALRDRVPKSKDFWRGGPQAVSTQVSNGLVPIDLDFLNDIRLAQTEIWAQQGETLNAATDWREDFSKAFEYLFAPELQRDAHLARIARDWLVGEQLTKEQLDQIGVERSLTTTNQALASILFLVRLLCLAKIPLILTIDQGERLLDKSWHVTDETRLENCKALHTLSEVVPREGALLILAGTAGVSLNLTADLRARFSQIIPCDPLQLSYAKNLLGVYLQTSREHNELPPSDSLFHPFESSAVKAMLVKSRANMRRFLQAAAQAFSRWGGQATIERIDIKELPVNPEEDITLRDVKQKIESVLSSRSWFYRYEPALADGKSREDLVLYDSSNRPRATVEISRAAFRKDEAIRALELLQQRRSNLPLIVIYTGYATPTVVNLLRERATVILYDETSFDRDVGDVVDTLARVKPPSSQAEPPAPPAQLTPLEAFIPVIDQARSYEASLGGALRVKSDEHARARREKRWREARAKWLQEQARIKEQIREGRRQRQQEELAELQHEARTAEKQRSARMWSRTIPTSVCLATLAILLGFLSYRESIQVSDDKPTPAKPRWSEEALPPAPMIIPDKTSNVAFLDTSEEKLELPARGAKIPERATDVTLMPGLDDTFTFELHPDYASDADNGDKMKARVADANKRIAALPTAVRKKSIGPWPQDLATLEADLTRAEENQTHRSFSSVTAILSSYLFAGVAAVLWPALATSFVAWNPLAELAQPVGSQGELVRRARTWWTSRDSARTLGFLRSQLFERYVRSLSGRCWVIVPPTLVEMVRDRNPNYRYAALQAVIESRWQLPEAREAIKATDEWHRHDYRYASAVSGPGPHASAFPGPVECVDLATLEQVPCVRRAYLAAAGSTDELQSLIYEQRHKLPPNWSDAPYFIEAINGFGQAADGSSPDTLHSLMSHISRLRSPAIGPDYLNVFEQLFAASDAEVLTRCFVTGGDPEESDTILQLPHARLERAVTLFSWNEGLGRNDYLQSISHIDEIYLFLRRLQYYQLNPLLFVSESSDNQPTAN